MAIRPFFHVGIIVENLEAAMAELSDALGVVWRTPHVSQYGDWTIKVVYSRGEAPYIELIEGGQGGPWDVSKGSHIDHIGFYSEDVVEEAERLVKAGLPIDFDPASVGRGHGFCYHKALACGVRIELIDASRKASHAPFLSEAVGGDD